MATKKHYTFFEDGQHGWLRVEKTELSKLKIDDKISGFSYVKGKYVYLEEDLDCGIFLVAVASKMGIDASDVNSHEYTQFRQEFWSNCGRSYNENTPIRKYNRYEALTISQQKFCDDVKKYLTTKGNYNFRKSDMNKVKNGNFEYCQLLNDHFNLGYEY